MLEIWEQWVTQFTEFTCEVCASLDGVLFRQYEGPHPPLHPRCRCRRRFHHQVWIDAPATSEEVERDEL
jgi:hypothetical protein